PAAAHVAALRSVDGDRRGDLLSLQRASQPGAAPRARPAVKLYSKIFLGLSAGGLCGLAVNFWASGAAWVRWLDTNVAGPLGQIFLRLLLMTVVPLVFTSITLGVAQLGHIRKVGRVGLRSLAYFLLFTVIL